MRPTHGFAPWEDNRPYLLPSLLAECPLWRESAEKSPRGPRQPLLPSHYLSGGYSETLPAFCWLSIPGGFPRPANSGPLRNLKAEHHQFTVDPRRAPGWILRYRWRDVCLKGTVAKHTDIDHQRSQASILICPRKKENSSPLVSNVPMSATVFAVITSPFRQFAGREHTALWHFAEESLGARRRIDGN